MELPFEAEVATLIKWPNSVFNMDHPHIQTLANLIRRIVSDDELHRRAYTRSRRGDLSYSSREVDTSVEASSKTMWNTLIEEFDLTDEEQQALQATSWENRPEYRNKNFPFSCRKWTLQVLFNCIEKPGEIAS